MVFEYGTEFGRERPSSPCARKEASYIRENELNLRKAVEKAMVDTGMPNKRLFIFSRGSSYVLQHHYIAKSRLDLEHILEKENIKLSNTDQVDVGVSSWRRDVHPDVWRDFLF